jgi:glycosyltransferase involved in cell wall biosynthesis
MVELSVIIPAYNEAQQLTATLEETTAWLSARRFRYEIVVVDDGSLDQTYDVARQFAHEHPSVKPVRIEQNRGKGFALKLGIAFASGDFVAFLDADLDISPNQIGILQDVLKQSGADGVVGSKRHPEATIGTYPLPRRAISAGYSLLMRLLFGLPLHDTQTGIKLFRRSMLMDVMPRLLIKRFAFDLELLACAHRLGYHIVEAPIAVNFNRPESRITWQDIKATGLDTLAIFYRIRWLRYYDD